MPHRHLPTQPLHPNAVPDIADRSTWQRSRNELLSREKAHTREGDAIAAARRRLPMTQVPDDATAGGPNGPIPFAHIFEGRRMLLAYFHMWHDGEPWERQCEGCTFTASHLLRLEYLHERDVTAVVLSQGTYGESKPYADFLGYPAPWYSARDSETLLAGREFGFIACYLRTDEHAYETYWTTDRGTEAADTSYHLLDLTVFGRQERWEDSPQDWPRQPEGQHQWRALGRPTAQWSVTDEPVAP
jgi:predicted dithiol-disulfide oxidoreductase (DUF899 family)